MSKLKKIIILSSVIAIGIGLLIGYNFIKVNNLDKIKYDYLNEINANIADTSIKDFIKDEVKLSKVEPYGKLEGYRFNRFYLEIELQDDFKDSTEEEIKNLLKKFEVPPLKDILGSKSYEYLINKSIVTTESITLKNDSDTYKIEPQSSFQLSKNGSILESKTVKSKKPESSESPYEKEELENDSAAPSNNPDDYNSDGEYVPSEGPSDNPEDYNAGGEYKPAEDMTQEEIQRELEGMLGN